MRLRHLPIRLRHLPIRLRHLPIRLRHLPIRLRHLPIRLRHAVLGACLATLLGAGCFQVAGYDDFEFQEPFRGRLAQSTIDKIDLLFVIDNSRGIADKHAILQETLEAFVERLVNPRCLDAEGRPATQPPSADASCPIGERREFEPARDMHIGIITTSLGGHGADSCMGASSPTENDRAHLVDRDAPESNVRVPTYQDLGFLAWDPDKRKSPAGEDDAETLVDNLSSILFGVGEVGCGYEAPLEAWYRFLVEPEPYLDIVVENNVGQLVGVDEVVLAQRSAFVRPDSLMAIVMVTDENDCSIRDGGTFHAAGQIYQPGTNSPYHLPKARAACAIDPNDPCCRSCGQDPGDGCDTSQDDCGTQTHSALTDNINLRCFDQKRRFGIDFLYPIDRYVTGLTSPQVPNLTGELVDNPLLAGRPAGRVVLAGIVGVPWQDIARVNDQGEPDLRDGLDVLDQPIGGVKNAAELLQQVAGADSAWELIVGNPEANVPPFDPLMIESVDPRSGVHPLTSDPLTAPGAASFNDINGGEYDIPQRDDLQHACYFFGKDCSQSEDPSCLAGRGQSCENHACRPGLTCAPDMRCAEACDGSQMPFTCYCDTNNPLCRDAEGNFTMFKYAESAYPGRRLLQALRDVGSQGIVGSICPFQVDDPSLPDFGFTPALSGAVVERLKGSLKEHLCLDRSLLPDDRGHVPCVLVEARAQPDGTQCSAACAEKGRRPATDEHAHVVALAQDDTSRGCFCEVEQLTSDADLIACETAVSEPFKNSFGQEVNGWCFVDAMSDPALGEPALAAACPSDRRRVIRLVGSARQAPDSRLYLYCD